MTMNDFWKELKTNSSLSADAQNIVAKKVAAIEKEEADKNAMNAELQAAALALVTDAAEPVTASAAADEMGTTVPKATYILKNLPGVKVTKVIVGNRVVNGYSI